MKKLIILICIIVLLVAPMISAEELLQFDNIKQYDEVTKTVTIVNTFGIGRDISTIQLKTPLNYYVGAGYGKVAEFEINLFDDTYSDVFNDMIFINKRNDDEISRDFDYKYKTTELIDVNDYKEICDPLNKTGCESILIGTHKEEREVWKDLDTSVLTKGKITIGIFTDVQVGDYVEWIPTFFGKEINEWATWTASLNVDIYLYFKFDTNVTTIDSVAGFNTTTNALNVTGKIGNAYEYSGSLTGAVGYKPYTSSINAGSYNFWMKTSDTVFTAFSQDGAGTTNNVDTQIGGGGGAGAPFCAGGQFCMSINRVVTVTTAIGNVNDGAWHMATITVDGTTHRLYVDGLNVDNDTSALNIFGGKNGSNGFVMGDTTFTGTMDEIGVWNRTLTSAEVTQLYNGGDGITFTTIFAPTIVLNSPVDNANLTNNTVSFNGTISGVTPLNVSLIVNDTYLETNTSGNLSDYLFTKTLPDGTHNWTYESCAVIGCVNATTRTLNIDTSPNITLTKPDDNAESITSFIGFNGTVTTPIIDLINVSLIINDVYNGTNSSGIEGNYTFLRELSQQVLNWTFEACNPSGCNNATTRTLTIHTTPTTVIIIEPVGVIDNILLGSNQTFSWNVSEPGVNLSEHVIECLFIYNGDTFNVTDICITTNSSSFLYVEGVNFLNFSVREEFGFITEVNTTWSYKLIEGNQTFSATTVEGDTESFKINLTIDPGFAITATALIYNGTLNIGTFSNLQGDVFEASKDLIVPQVTADENVSFFWQIFLNDSTDINLSSNNQTILNLLIDNCSSNNFTLFNYTVVDEEFQTKLAGTIVEVDLNVSSFDESVSILNFSSLYNNTNPVEVCSNLNLVSLSIRYKINSIVRYEATDHAIEYYNIDSFTLDNSSTNQNITLFDLLSADSTEFQITVKDAQFLLVEGGLIQVNRQYISEGTFKTVEIPITDSNGQTVAHLVEKDVIYNLIIIKDGVVVATFNNVIAFCEDATIGLCQINLQAVIEGQPVYDEDEALGIIGFPVYNQTSRVLSLNFVSVDGVSRNVTLRATKLDTLGNTSACSQTLISASGLITCAIAQSIGNSTLFVEVFVNRVLTITDVIQLLDEADYGTAGYFFLFVMVLSLALMFAQSKTAIIIGVLIGMIAGSLLSLIQGGILGIGSAIIWLVIAGLILLWKLNKGRQN